MSSMPERDTPGQSGGGTGQSARPGDWSTPRQGSAPGQERFGPPAGSIPGQPEAGQAGSQWAGQQGGWAGQQGGWGGQPASAPITAAETRVTWRRIFQYWIDAFFVSVIPYLVSIPFDRSASTIMHVIGGVVYVVLFVLIGLWYWVIWPHSHHGQTFAMKWFGLRVISKEGEPASLLQLFVRWISLLFDSAPWMWPFTGLLGLIVMLCSRHRQRIGDHLARTLVIKTASGVYSGTAGGVYEGTTAPGHYGRAGTSEAGPAQPATAQSGTVPPQPSAAQETGAGGQSGADQAGAAHRSASGGPAGTDEQRRGDNP
ncbi:MAG TPA: RDD family protein [Streptosporangiaceae bacterium]|nr:RDD family protein [Streptosporangiaceae bacterium]